MMESLHVFIDESGVHDDSPVVTVAMYAGQPTDWRLFVKNWNAAKKPIKIIHAADCANRTGEFEGWDRDRRNAFAAQLLPVLPSHNIVGVAVGINLEHFRAAMAAHPELAEMVGTPYSACFQWAVQTFLNVMGRYGYDQPVHFFHEHNDYEDEARIAFDFVQAHRPTKEPIALTCWPMRLTTICGRRRACAVHRGMQWTRTATSSRYCITAKTTCRILFRRCWISGDVLWPPVGMASSMRLASSGR